jgi:hypothetical protein
MLGCIVGDYCLRSKDGEGIRRTFGGIRHPFEGRDLPQVK